MGILKKLLAFLALLLFPTAVLAVNVTVPAASASGYFVISTTTGAYTTLSSSSTANVWIDGNRTDTYAQTGSIVEPFKTMSGALAGLPAGYSGYSFNLAPGTYVDGAPDTFPQNPFYLSGNEATLVEPSGVTFPNSFDIFDLTIVGAVHEADTALAAIHQFVNGVIVGSVQMDGLATVNNESINGGMYFLVSTSSLSNIAGSYIQNPIWNQGVLNINDDQLATNTKEALISATTTGFLSTGQFANVNVLGATMINLTGGPAINIPNGATSTINNLTAFTAVVNGSHSIMVGNAKTDICDFESNNLTGAFVAPEASSSAAWVPCYDEALNVVSTTTTANLFATANAGIGTTTAGGKLFYVAGNVSGGIARFDRITAGVANSLFGTQDIGFWDTSPGNDLLGPTQTFTYVNGTSGTRNILGQIGAMRRGADNTGSFQIYANSLGVASQSLVVDGSNGDVVMGSSTPSNSSTQCGNYTFCNVYNGSGLNEAQIKNIASSSAGQVRTFFNARDVDGVPADERGEIGTETNHNFSLFTNNTARVTITLAGGVNIGPTYWNGVTFPTASGNLIVENNVGIATSSPGSALSIGSIANFTTATSTFYSTGGINLTSGCLTYNGGTCIGAVTSSASSTLLGDNNTFSGTSTFTKAFSDTGTFGTTTLASGQGFTIGSSQFVLQQGSGNVGIAVSSPAFPLDVTGALSNVAHIQSTGQSGLADTLVLDDFGNAAVNRGTGILFKTPGSASSVNGARIASAVESTSANSYLAFSTQLSSTLAERVRISAAGLLGIGTSTPGGLLSVAGSSGGTTPLLMVSSSTAAFATSTVFEIDKNGLAGIGTTTPGTIFSINNIANFDTATTSFYNNLVVSATVDQAAVAVPELAFGTGASANNYAVSVSGGRVMFGYSTGVGAGSGELIGGSGHSLAFYANQPNNTFATSNITPNFYISGGGVGAGTAGSVSIGTSTPTAIFQATNLNANATTSIQFGKANQNKGTCMTYYDTAGSPVYMFIAAGATTFTAQNGGTAPSGCQN